MTAAVESRRFKVHAQAEREPVSVDLDGSSAVADKTQLNIQNGRGHQFIHFLNEFWLEHSGEAL